MRNSYNKNMKTKFGTKPYIGTKDLVGRDLQIFYYITNKWRQLAQKYNYTEYLPPILEDAMLYKLKSGEDVGGKELYEFTDKGGRNVAIRPEATPSITRIVAKTYNKDNKPIRMFSIANFMRYERPQRGRLREFWQLNVDIFGLDNVSADVEILKLAVDSLLIFNPPASSFKIYVNSRPLMDLLLQKLVAKDKVKLLQKLIDKFTKLTQEEFKQLLEQELQLPQKDINRIIALLNADFEELKKLFKGIEETAEYKRLRSILNIVKGFRYDKYIQFNPAIVRGLDYYDGIVFEAFDLNPQNNRALFGGGRYNGLGYLFGLKNMPAVGFGAGNVPIQIFLETWNLIPDSLDNSLKVYIPQLLKSETGIAKIFEVANVIDKLTFFKNLKQELKIELGTKPSSISKAIKYALNKEFDYIIILSEDELKDNKIAIKNLKDRKQVYINLE